MKINKIDTKDLNFYRKKGWVKIKDFLSKNELLSIKKSTYSFLRKNHKKYISGDINYVNNKKIFREINSFHKLEDNKKIKRLGKKICKSKLVKKLLNHSSGELRASEFFAKPAKIGLYSPIHQDNYYWNVKNDNALTIWIALNKSGKKNGGVFYFDGSHKLGLLDHKSSFAKGSSQTVKKITKLNKLKKSLPSLQTGDALIHHVLVAHGSKNNKSNSSRAGVTFQIKDKKSKYDQKKIMLYRKKLQLQISKR